jgi:hypothetical protein
MMPPQKLGGMERINKRKNRRLPGFSQVFFSLLAPLRSALYHYLLTGSSFQERRSVPVGYLPEVFSPSQEYAIYFASFGI